MNEKRFTYDKPLVAFSKGGINDNVTGETYEFTMGTVLDLLNELAEENEQLKHYKLYEDNKRLQTIIADLKKENEQLRKQCFELEKDYLIETSDISDKIYLDDEIKELKQKYGDGV